MSALEYSEKFASNVRALPKNVHHCSICTHFTTSVFSMVNHVRRHRSSLQPFDCGSRDVEYYYCKDCDFQTELTLCFKQHLLRRHSVEIHLTNEEYTIQKYICEKCRFETHSQIKRLQHRMACGVKWGCVKDVRKKVFTSENHKISKHLNDTDLSWNHWTKCVERANANARVVSNIVTRFDAAEITSSSTKVNGTAQTILPHFSDNGKKCPYTSKQKANLKKHVDALDLEKDAIKWYESNKCTYKTKIKKHLDRHMNAYHVEGKVIKWYTCKNCQYESKHVHHLKNHIKAYHLDEQDLVWYRCEQCPYKAKQTAHLKRHVNMHHDREVTWYECDQCPYKTKYKYYFNQHMDFNQHRVL